MGHPYATKMDLESTYGEDLVASLADTDGNGVPNEETIEQALYTASSIIDAHLAARYSVPVFATPVVRDLAVDIALYRLAYSRLKQTQEMRLRYEDAIGLLKRIAEGKASIGLDLDGDGSGDGDGEGDGGSDDQSGSIVGRTGFLERA